MIPKKPAPNSIRGGYRFSEKTLLKQQAKAKQRIDLKSFRFKRRDNNQIAHYGEAWRKSLAWKLGGKVRRVAVPAGLEASVPQTRPVIYWAFLPSILYKAAPSRRRA
jgi:hypothetical protein